MTLIIIPYACALAVVLWVVTKAALGGTRR